MFSIELKFTVDCFKFWFQKNHKIIELDVDEKEVFRRKNLLTKQTLCYLCDFPIERRAENGWAQHVFKAEQRFLENIYSKKQIDQMGIKNFETFSLKLKKILDNIDLFCQSLEIESYQQQSNDDDEIENIIDKIKKIRTTITTQLADKKIKQLKKKRLLIYISIKFVLWKLTKLREKFRFQTNFYQICMPFLKIEKLFIILM